MGGHALPGLQLFLTCLFTLNTLDLPARKKTRTPISSSRLSYRTFGPAPEEGAPRLSMREGRTVWGFLGAFTAAAQGGRSGIAKTLRKLLQQSAQAERTESSTNRVSCCWCSMARELNRMASRKECLQQSTSIEQRPELCAGFHGIHVSTLLPPTFQHFFFKRCIFYHTSPMGHECRGSLLGQFCGGSNDFARAIMFCFGSHIQYIRLNLIAMSRKRRIKITGPKST